MTACDLYPVLPAGFDMDAALEVLRDILPRPEVTALRLPCGWTPEKAQLSKLVDLLHANGVAMIPEVSVPLSSTPDFLLGLCDYVAFPAGDLELVTWWSSVMELPGVAENITTATDASSAITAGADFLAIPLQFDGKDKERFSAMAVLAAG
jgi:thiamine-phosphate pyrophosphorylase